MDVVVYMEKTGLKVGQISPDGKVSGDSLFVKTVDRVIKNHGLDPKNEKDRVNIAKIAGGSYSIVRME